MSSFSNSVYYKLKNQRNGSAPLNYNSSIESFIENEDMIWLPRAFEDSLIQCLNKAKIPYEVHNHRLFLDKLDVEFRGELKPNQTKALEVLTKRENGVLNAATGFGKTIVSLALIAKLKRRTLVLVNSKQLLSQWEEQVRKFLTIKTPVPEEKKKRTNKTGIGIIGNQKDSHTGLVDIAMIQTVYSKCCQGRPDWLDDYDLVIVDECHHVAAESFKFVLQNIRAKYVYGLSATAKRKNGDEKIIFAYCGGIAYKITAEEVARENKITQILFPRFTYSKIVNQNRINPIYALKELCSDDSRNNLIINDICTAYNQKRHILVLSGLIEHTKTLGEMLGNKDIPYVIITGQHSKKEINERMGHLKKGQDDSVIIATSRFMGEGIDIPQLDTLFLVTPSSFEGITTQQAGRISRKTEGKKEVFIYDYVDYNIEYFKAMYFKRMKTYHKLGYIVYRDESNNMYERSSFFSQENFLSYLIDSIKKAKESILIASPIVLPSNNTKKILSSLNESKGKGLNVTIFSEPQVEYREAFIVAEELFKENGLSLNIKHCFSSYVIIDNEEIWFGNLSILGTSYKKESERYLMHFFDKKLASEFTEMSNGFLLG